MTTKINEINQVAKTIEKNLEAANEAIESAMRMLEANSVAEWAFLNRINGEVSTLVTLRTSSVTLSSLTDELDPLNCWNLANKQAAPLENLVQVQVANT